jgi:hypothetical protein
MGKGDKGVIGEYYEDGFPVIIKFVDELPTIATQKHFSSLTIISWKYDGTLNNGMPIKHINDKMIRLEKALYEAMSRFKSYVHAYSRTGNNLKEFVYL